MTPDEMKDLCKKLAEKKPDVFGWSDQYTELMIKRPHYSTVIAFPDGKIFFNSQDGYDLAAKELGWEYQVEADDEIIKGNPVRFWLYGVSKIVDIRWMCSEETFPDKLTASREAFFQIVKQYL